MYQVPPNRRAAHTPKHHARFSISHRRFGIPTKIVHWDTKVRGWERAGSWGLITGIGLSQKLTVSGRPVPIMRLLRGGRTTVVRARPQPEA